MRVWKFVLLAVAIICVAPGCSVESGDAIPSADRDANRDAQRPSDVVSAQRLADHIAVLASDTFEGRAPGTEGGEKTKAYIAAAFEEYGLEPMNGDYLHPVSMVEATLLPEQSYFRVNERTLQFGSEAVYWTKTMQDAVTLENSELVFVGYGINAPEHDWNDYEGVDVAGKIVVMLINDPGAATNNPQLFNGAAMTHYGRWDYKFAEAARRGAAGALIVHESEPAAYGWSTVQRGWAGPQLDIVRDDVALPRVAVEGWLSVRAAQDLFSEATLDFDALKAEAASTDFRAVSLDGIISTAQLKTKIRLSEEANVIGVVPGAEAPDEYILYMAHWDHLGTNPAEPGEDQIFNGAVDNATGVAAILEIARAFAERPQRPKRSILIAAVTSEDPGLIGATQFAAAPPAPLRSIVGGINIDAMLPTPPASDVVVVGYGASELEEVLKEQASIREKTVSAEPDPSKGLYYRSDHVELAKTGVPMLYAHNGVRFREDERAIGLSIRRDYVRNKHHTPDDEFDESWRMDGITEMVDILYRVGEALATSDEWPNWYEGHEFRALRDAQREAPPE